MVEKIFCSDQRSTVTICCHYLEDYKEHAKFLTLCGYYVVILTLKSPVEEIVIEQSGEQARILIPSNLNICHFEDSKIPLFTEFCNEFPIISKILSYINRLKTKTINLQSHRSKIGSIKAKMARKISVTIVGKLTISACQRISLRSRGILEFGSLMVLQKFANSTVCHSSQFNALPWNLMRAHGNSIKMVNFLPAQNTPLEMSFLNEWNESLISLRKILPIESNLSTQMDASDDAQAAILYASIYSESPFTFLGIPDASLKFLSRAVHKRRLVIFVAAGFNVNEFSSSRLSSILLKFGISVDVVFERQLEKEESFQNLKNVFPDCRKFFLSDLGYSANSKEYNIQSEISHNLAEVIWKDIIAVDQRENYINSLYEKFPQLGILFRESVAIELLNSLIFMARLKKFDETYSNIPKIFIDANSEPRFSSQIDDPSSIAFLPQGHFPNSISRTFEAWRAWVLRSSNVRVSENFENRPINIPEINIDALVLHVQHKVKNYAPVFIEGSICISLAPGDTQYRETALSVTRHYLNLGKSVRLFITALEKSSRFHFEDFCRDCEQLRGDHAHTFDFSHLKENNEFLEIEVAGLALPMKLIYEHFRQTDASNYFVETIMRRLEAYIRIGFFKLCQSYIAFEFAFQKSRPTVVVAIPDRPSLSLAMSLAAQSLRVPQLSVESSLFGRQPRLKPMSSDLICVIDSYASHLLTDYYGVSSSKIAVIGSSHLYERNKQIRQLKENTQHETGVNDPVVLTVCTQSDGLDANMELVRWCASAVSHHDNMHLVLKIHPSESEDRVHSYETLLSRTGISFETVIDGFHGVLLRTSILCTRYSTVCYEAYFADVPTITCLIEGDDRVLDFEEIGIGLNADSLHEFLAIVDGLSDSNSAISSKLRTLKGEYAKKNHHLTERDPLLSLASIIDGVISSSEVSNEPPMPM